MVSAISHYGNGNKLLSFDFFVTIIVTLLSVFVNKNIIFFLFLYYLFFENGRLLKLCISRIIYCGALYCMMLPNNYLPFAWFTILFIYIFMYKKNIIHSLGVNSIIISVIIIQVIFSAIINATPLINFVFAIICYMPLVYFFVLSSSTSNIDLKMYRKYFDRLLMTETVATIFNFIVYLFANNALWDAWSCGTFGVADQAQFFVIIGFLFFVYYSIYTKTREQRALFSCAICLIIMLSTYNWSLVVVFIVGFLGYIFTEGWDVRSNTIRGVKRKIAVVIGVILVLAILFVIAPPFVINTISYFFSGDNAYFNYRFYKVVVYKMTFFDIPRQDYIFLLFGNGIGYFCSRAALICTGSYVDFYSTFFAPSMSNYTHTYLYFNIMMAYQDPTSSYGSVLARPYSSILALMGEGGITLLILFFACLFAIMKKYNNIVWPITIFWIGVSFVENYFEYPKVLLMLTICYSFLAYQKKYLT